MINRPYTIGGGRAPYEKPQIKRVTLALEETLSTACKLHGPESPCNIGEKDGYYSGS